MFDDPKELLAKIRLGEDSLLEVESVRFQGDRVTGPAREKLADALASLANTRGGVLLLGVDDRTRTIDGIDLAMLDAAEALVREACNDSVKPPLPAVVVRLELPNASGVPRPIIRVDVARGLFVHKSPGGYMFRVGSSVREMPTEYLARLFQQQSQARLIAFDEQVVPRTGLGDLDVERARPYLAPGEPDETALHKLALLVPDEEGVLRASVAGLLLFGREPQRFLPGARIDAVAYRGSVAWANYQLDARICEGTLGEQIEEALRFLRRNMRIGAQKTPARIDLPAFDEPAVYEAVVNAVAHRDYAIHGSAIRFFMFDDRLEIHSPGFLPNTVTLDTIASRQATRNELLVRFLSRMRASDLATWRTHLMEARGEGVPLILSRSNKVSGREPVYEMPGEELKLTIWARPLAPETEESH